MLTGVTIRNFRGLRDVTVDEFSRVNIVVGDNGSGKTSLLEAIYLAMSNSPLTARQLPRIRTGAGHEKENWDAAIATVAEILAEGAQELTVVTRGGKRFERTMNIRRGPDTMVGDRRDAPVAGGTLLETNIIAEPLEFRWVDGDQRTQVSRFSKSNPEYATGSGEVSRVGVGYLPSQGQGLTGWARFYSSLDKSGDTGPYLAAMREQFPELDVIALQFDGTSASLHARFKGQRQQRPLEDLSGGLSRLSALLLAMSVPELPIIVIDEIENGLHHSRFPLMWRQVRAFAARFNKQVFATTHSQECLDAAAEAMMETPEDFALVRTAVVAGAVRVGVATGEPMRHLLQSGLEVRG